MSRRNPLPIDKVLSWAHNLQSTCFGTKISVKIETSDGSGYGKHFSVEIFATGDVERYVFDSTMPNETLYQEWGRCKDKTSRLLDELVGRRINAHGH